MVKRSLRIAALEGKAQQKAAEEELAKEKSQQMVLHQRIASLLKKVEYMDRKRSDAEDKLREEKKKKAGAGGAEKDKEITKLKRQLAKAGSTVYITGREPHTSPPPPLAKPQGCGLTRAGP